MKNEEQRNVFLPAEIDEQIDDYLAATPASGDTLGDTSAQASVRDIQAYFAPPEQDEALNRVWQRFNEQRANIQAHQTDQQSQPSAKVLTLATKTSSTRQKASSSFRRQLSILAAVIVVALLIGSTLLLFQSGRHASKQIGLITQPTGMFALVNQTLYRLDTQTHHPLWQFQASGSQPVLSSFPGQAIDGTYYIWGANGKQTTIYALDVANGRLRWQKDAANMGNIAVSGNTVYISSEKDNYLEVVALNVLNGSQKWERRLIQIHKASNLFPITPFISLLAASDTAVYGTINTSETHGYQRFALSAQDGQFKWQQNEVSDNPDFQKSSIQGFLVDGVLCVVQRIETHKMEQIDKSNGLLQGYDAQSGKQLWSKTLDNIPSEATLLNGTIYLDTNFDNSTTQKKGSIYAFSARDGSLLWQYHRQVASSYPTVTAKGIYTNLYGDGKAGQALVALDTATGKQRWTYTFHDPITVEYPPAADDNQVYLSLPGNTIQILRASDGKPLGSFKIDPQHVDPNNRVLLQIVTL